MLNLLYLNSIFNIYNNKLITILMYLNKQINNMYLILKNINLINYNNKEIYCNILISYK